MTAGLCGPVVFSEVMFHPQSSTPNSEFVEIINLADTSIDLTGWRLADLYSVDDLVGGRLILEPDEIAIVFEADYDTTTGPYRDLIPGEAIILFTSGEAIGNGLSNSGDAIFLITATGDTVDTIGWDQDIAPGHSLEKVILDDCTLPGNWRPGMQLLGTPGGPNSVAGQEIDLALETLDWEVASPPGNFAITATIHNHGLVAASGRLLAAGTDAADIPTLAAGADTAVTFDWEAPAGILGLYSLTVRLTAPGDYDTTNNSLSVEMPIAAPDRAVVVNEIMYTPLSGQPEWVELVNTTASTVNLKSWQVRDEADGVLLPEERLSPGEYVVVTGDSAGAGNWLPGIFVIIVSGFPALNNTGDQVILLSPAGVVIDEVDYSRFPLTKSGRSLEKVSLVAPSQEATSWVTSPAPQGHTAGRENSVLLPEEQAGLTLVPNPLRLNTPESSLKVAYVTPFSTINLLVEIYDLAGRRLGTVFNEGPVPGTGAVTWDAQSVDPVRYKTGQYVLLFRARDTGSSRRWERMERLILVQ